MGVTGDEESHSSKSYSEGLQVIHGDLVAVEVQKSILEHATVAVPARVNN